MADTTDTGGPQQPEAPVRRARWFGIGVVIVAAILIVAALATAGGGDSGTRTAVQEPLLEEDFGPGTTLAEHFTEQGVPLCDDLAAEAGGPVPAGSLIDVKEDLGGSRLEVAFAEDLHVDGVPASDAKFTVTEADLDDVTCERDAIIELTACRVRAPVELHLIYVDGEYSYAFARNDWLWQGFTYDGWAFVLEGVYGLAGWTESNELECCLGYDGDLPLPGETDCPREAVTS